MFRMDENPKPTIYRNKNHFEFYSTPRSFLNCRVVASVFSAPGSGSPSPVEVAPAGLCRVVATFFSQQIYSIVAAEHVFSTCCLDLSALLDSR